MLRLQRQVGLRKASWASKKVINRLCSKLRSQSAGPSVQTVPQLLELDPSVAQSLAQACAGTPEQLLQANVQQLRKEYFLKDVQQLAENSPAAFCLPISDWQQFFEGYGLGKEAFYKALRYSSSHLASTDVFTAGAAIRWLKQLGPWTAADIINRLIPCYPQVLSTPTDVLQALVDKLTSLGMDESSVQELLWECPGLLAEFREEQLPLIVRMVESRRNKYTNGGTYID